MDKPLIGVLPLVDIGRDSYWMLPGYMKGIEQAGGIPVMLPLTGEKSDIAQIAKMADGFLFTGGQDVSPEIYGMGRTKKCEECSQERDQMETELFLQVYEQGKPVLGICRGIQLINAALGGTLYQDLATEHPSLVSHRQSPPYDMPAHMADIVEGSPLHVLLGMKEIPVNSCHHQAIRVLSERLSPMAYSPDGLTEAVYAPGKPFVWAVQWHPEFNYQKEESSRRIFNAFIENAREFL